MDKENCGSRMKSSIILMSSSVASSLDNSDTTKVVGLSVFIPSCRRGDERVWNVDARTYMDKTPSPRDINDLP